MPLYCTSALCIFGYTVSTNHNKSRLRGALPHAMENASEKLMGAPAA